MSDLAGPCQPADLTDDVVRRPTRGLVDHDDAGRNDSTGQCPASPPASTASILDVRIVRSRNRPTGGGSDNLTGRDGDDDIIRPRKGEDETFDFGPGDDTVNYGAMYGSGIHLDLAAETSSGAAGDDTLRDVENVCGSNGDDVLLGSDAAERLEGWDGDDVVNGMGGDDVIEDTWGSGEVLGGSGNDRVVLNWVGGYAYDGVDTLDARALFVDEGESFVIDVAGGQITNPESAAATGIENVIGQLGRDVLRGDAARNELIGGDGADRLIGRDGNDVLTGGPGADNADGGPGSDSCTAETVTNCEG
ncbi:MAG TPA: hypothetical protein VEX15_01775 [Nocardioidaceae bacterium]|nr:hypothetical protein [Nocardioidaceae bacterium]